MPCCAFIIARPVSVEFSPPGCDAHGPSWLIDYHVITGVWNRVWFDCRERLNLNLSGYGLASCMIRVTVTLNMISLILLIRWTIFTTTIRRSHMEIVEFSVDRPLDWRWSQCWRHHWAFLAIFLWLICSPQAFGRAWRRPCSDTRCKPNFKIIRVCRGAGRHWEPAAWTRTDWGGPAGWTRLASHWFTIRRIGNLYNAFRDWKRFTTYN